MPRLSLITVAGTVCAFRLSGGGHPASERCVRVGIKLSIYGMEYVSDIVHREDGARDLDGYARERWVSEGRCRRGTRESTLVASNKLSVWKPGNGRRFPEKRKRSRERSVRRGLPKEWERSRCVTSERPYGSAMSAESLDASQVSRSLLALPTPVSMLPSSSLLWVPPSLSTAFFPFSTSQAVLCRG